MARTAMQREQRGAAGEHGVGGRGCRWWGRPGTSAGNASALAPSARMAAASAELRGDQRLEAPRPAQRGQRAQREHERAGGQRRRAGERDHAVRADEHARRREAVHGEQRGHRRERRAEQHRAPVAAADAGDGQDAEATVAASAAAPTSAKWVPAPALDGLGLGPLHHRAGDHRQRGDGRDERERSVVRAGRHKAVIGRARGAVESAGRAGVSPQPAPRPPAPAPGAGRRPRPPG